MHPIEDAPAILNISLLFVSCQAVADYNMADAYIEKELLLKQPLRIGLVQNYPFKARRISISAIHEKELLMGSVLNGD